MPLRRFRTLLTSMVLLGASLPALAETFTFNASIDSDFLYSPNWSGGAGGTPTPANMAAGDTYRVVAPAVLHGTALNAGTLEIEATGSLTVDSAGSLELTTACEVTGGGTLTVQGLLRTSGTNAIPVNCPLVLNNTAVSGRVLEIAPGTEIQNGANVSFTAGEALVRGAWKHNQSPLRVLAGATIAGEGFINGELRLFGRLEPGSETGTEDMHVQGNLQCIPGCVMEFGVAGGGAGEFDRLFVSGQVEYAGELVVDFSARPLAEAGTYDFLTSGSGALTFATRTPVGLAPNRSFSYSPATPGQFVVSATDIVIPGSATGYTTTDKDWMSNASNDIDGNGLGSDGWLFFGNFDGIPESDRPFTHRIESLPSYVTSVVAGASFLSVADEYDTDGPGFGIIDNPTTLDGSDARGGAVVADGGAAGDSLEILSFTVSGLTAPVRVGILAGTEQRVDGRWDPTSITLSDGTYSATVGDHATSPLPAVPDSVTPNNVGWVFFDLYADGTYTISATKRLATQGVSIGGLTFDTALPAPVLHLAFEEAAGTTTTESISGASDIATLIEGPARVAGLAPSSTGALDFQITTPGSYVDAGTLQSDGQYAAKDSATDSKVLNGQWTMAAWVEIPVGTSGGDRCILTSDNDLSDPWLFFVTSVNGRSNNLGFDFGAVRIRSNLNVPTGRPVFVAVSADPAASAFGSGNKHRFAIWDGVTWSYVEGSTYAAARLKGLEIGSWNSGQRQFNGAIDEVRIYDTALSKEELTALALQNTIGAGLGGMVSSPALPTNSSSVDFTVQFTEPVTGFDASDLIVACDPPGSLVCGTPVITGAGSLYQVSVPVQGEGTLLLDLQTGSGIQNLAGDPLAIQSGGSAIIDLTPPQLLSITPSTTGTVTSADFLIFTAVFSEPVLGLNATTLDTSGSGPGTIVTIDFSTIDGINHSFKAVLTVNDGDTGSSLRVSVLLDAGVTDLAGNALIGPVPTSADVIFSASPYQLWAINKGLTAGLNFASNLDPDGDGRINGEECLHDGNPLVAGDPVKQRFHLVEQPGGKYGVLTLATPDSDPYDPIQTGRLVGAFGAPSVRVSDYIEASSNLADWGTGPGIVEDPSVLAPAGMPALSPGWTYRHFRFTDPVSVLPKAFIRSRVVVAP